MELKMKTWRLTLEHRRLTIQAYRLTLTMKLWRICRPVVAHSNHFYEEPDPHQNEKLDPEPGPHQSNELDP
jgi:hypothetical protein